MNVMLTGRTGFVGKHVEWRLGVRSHSIVDTFESAPDTMIHLAWSGLPNYESPDHYDNIGWQSAQIQEAVHCGIKNITISGTCLESSVAPCHYALAKRALWNIVRSIDPRIKWLRLPWLYGNGQREGSLLPSLRSAIQRGDLTFHVAPAIRVFADVAKVSEWICDCSEDQHIHGVIEYPGVAMTVADFCRSQVDCSSIQLVEDYPVKDYEQ